MCLGLWRRGLDCICVDILTIFLIGYAIYVLNNFTIILDDSSSEDNGTSYPTAAYRQDTKFRNRMQARQSAIKLGYNLKKTMTRVCDC